MHNAVVWLSIEDGNVAVNTARGREWPTNLERDPRANLLVINQDNPYEYVEIKGGVSEAAGGERAHRHARAEVHQPGQVPVAHGGRGAREVPHQPGQGPVREGRRAPGSSQLPARGGSAAARRIEACPPRCSRLLKTYTARCGPTTARGGRRRPSSGVAVPPAPARPPARDVLAARGRGRRSARSPPRATSTATRRPSSTPRPRARPPTAARSTPRRCSRPLRRVWWTSRPATGPAPAS